MSSKTALIERPITFSWHPSLEKSDLLLVPEWHNPLLCPETHQLLRNP